MFRNIVQSLITKGLVAGINFFILLVSSRYLGMSSRGEISILILNISVIQIINEIFTGYSLVYFIPKYNLKKIFIFGLVYTLLACSLSNGVFYVLGKQLHRFEWLSYVTSLIIILNTFNCVILLGKEKIKLYNYLNVVQPFILLAGIVFSIFALKIFTFEAFIFPLLLSFILAYFISLIATLNIVFSAVRIKEFRLKAILGNGFVCQLAILMHLFCNRLSYYLLPDTADVGLYSNASSLIESVLIIANGIAPILLARVANEGNTEHSVNATLSLSKISFLLSGVCVLVLAFIPDDFFILILGKEFECIKYYMLLYSPGILMVSFFSVMSNYFSAIGKLKTVLVCNSFGFVASVILAPILIKHFNIEGAALTANIAYLFVIIAVAVSFFRFNKLDANKLFVLTEDIIFLKKMIGWEKK
jgi:O-antigen/teichoic acid export membrane protein